jgi:broad specificity phosphatase PhoE
MTQSTTPSLVPAGAEAAWLARVARHRIDSIAQHCLAPLPEARADRFIFLRHGETRGNHLRIFQHAEIELNESGLAQAAEAAGLLADSGVRRILSSTMQRAWQTAVIAGKAMNLQPTEEPGLRERWFGDLVGTSSAEMDWSYDPPNGDRLIDFVGRTRQALAASLASTEPTLLVAHGGSLYVIAYSLGVTLREDMASNATPLLFERSNGRWSASHYGHIKLQRGVNIGW